MESPLSSKPSAGREGEEWPRGTEREEEEAARGRENKVVRVGLDPRHRPWEGRWRRLRPERRRPRGGGPEKKVEAAATWKEEASPAPLRLLEPSWRPRP
jgi:hypothetical protein